MQLVPTSKELYFLGICCFIQSGICSNIVWIFGASLGHSRDICSKIVTALKHVMDAAKLHSSIDLCSLSLSRFCTSANLGAKPLSIYKDVNHWCLITHHHHQWLWVIVDDVGYNDDDDFYNDDDDFWHLTMTEEDLVTSPSFLSTARALLSIHCRESMCAFNTCTNVLSFKPVWDLETCASSPCRSDGQGLWSPGSLQLSSGAQ